jgi:hypothetical protein
MVQGFRFSTQKRGTEPGTQTTEPQNPEQRCSSFCLVMRMLLMLAMLAQDHFHSILERELAFLEGDFFDLFGFREVMLGGELLESIF